MPALIGWTRESHQLTLQLPNSSLVAQLKISEASEKLEVQEKARDAKVPLVLTVMCQRGRSLDANKPLVAQPKDFRSS